MTNAILTSGIAFSACSYHCRRIMSRDALRVVFLALWVTLLGSCQDARAEEIPILPGAASERSIKAAFVYKFLTYVDWPPTAFAQGDSPIVIGVIGAEDIAAELLQVIGNRTVNNRPVVVRRLREGDSLIGVHVLFIGRGEGPRIGAIARAAQQRAILTVAEAPGAIEQGAMINFVLVEGRVRFDIALDTADRSGLRLSSRLLAVAREVRTGS
ncbi:MAG TPA: YfiR family protein [Casimicrobiaceae bacterium]|nr:YfiR family protein [Casimicrobiaceae bacterium]